MAENGYAKPVLVTSDWVAEHGDDDNVVIAEVDENTDLYEEGHIPGAVKLHWKDDLQDPLRRDIVEKLRRQGRKGIACPSGTVYGGAARRRVPPLPWRAACPGRSRFL